MTMQADALTEQNLDAPVNLQAGVQATADIDKPGDPSTHFIFSHKLFSIKDCKFARNGADKMSCFYIPMGEQIVAIELAKLQQEFNIPVESIDAALLLRVEKGLNYVKEIRPSDSIPREILDGSASWSVEEHHKETAVARLNMELIFWITGFREEMPPLAEMKKMQADAEGRGQIKDAHTKLAQLLKLSEAKVSRLRAEDISRETTYIEALRERSSKVAEILQKINAFASAFKKETTLVAELMRMQDLMRRALKNIGEKFAKVDNGQKEITKVMADPKTYITLIREMRDAVHIELKKWDDWFIRWADVKIERNEDTEKMFRKFYQFLAENYMEQQSWGSSTGAKKK